MIKCCLCGKEEEGYGNNPWPLREESFIQDIDKRTCSECTNKYVDRARMLVYYHKHDREKFIKMLQAKSGEELIDYLGYTIISEHCIVDDVSDSGGTTRIWFQAVCPNCGMQGDEINIYDPNDLDPKPQSAMHICEKCHTEFSTSIFKKFNHILK